MRFGFYGYIKYECGDMNIIIIVFYGGRLIFLCQVNGDDWLDRKNGCKDEFENCIYIYLCFLVNKDCFVRILRDRNIKEIV